MQNPVDAARKANAHVVLVSSALVTPQNRQAFYANVATCHCYLTHHMHQHRHCCRFNPIRLILNNIRWGLMDAKVRPLLSLFSHSIELYARLKLNVVVLQFAGENILRGSGLPFTVIRPGGLTDAEPGKAKLIASTFLPRPIANAGLSYRLNPNLTALA